MAPPVSFTRLGPDGDRLEVTAVEDNVFRVVHLPKAMQQPVQEEEGDASATPHHKPLDRSWFVCGRARDVPLDGRPRDDYSVFAGVSDSARAETPANEASGVFSISTPACTVTASSAGPVELEWKLPSGKRFARDFTSTPYVFKSRSGVVRHTMALDAAHEHIYGCGEAAGPLDRKGRRFRIGAIDAMGYECSPERGVSDPLYKHWPAFIVAVKDEETPRLNCVYGILYDSPCRGWLDFGCEVSAFRGSYRYAEFEDGNIDYYMIVGKDIADVTRGMMLLTGPPVLPPLWLLGYLGSTMAYTEASDAAERCKQFGQLCQKHDILCDGFHLSSGYTCVDLPDGKFGPRCVFTWNRRRVPDPKQLFQDFHDAGLKVMPNIKPWLLKDSHPEYTSACGQLAVLKAPMEAGHQPTPYVGVFWAGGAGTFADGAYVDFASEAGFQWWKKKAMEQLLAHGADALWNDNNEYEVDDDNALCGDGAAMQPLSRMRPVQGLLMARSSLQALQETDRQDLSGTRPVVITRSGCPGSQRYCAQTWSGDNRTSWRTLQWNTPMSLNLSVSGWPGCGHDVGAFAGPRPDAELLTRWVQSAVLMPRFTIHSWNDDNTCTEPWSHASALPAVRAAIKFRYTLLPYLYTLYHRAASNMEPIIRPLVFDFPHDQRIRSDNWDEPNPYLSHQASCDFMLGPSLLVCPIYRAGDRSRPVYLPDGTWWCNLATGTWHQGGTIIEVDSSLDDAHVPVFVRNGTILVTLSEAPKRNTSSIATNSGRVATVFLCPKDDATTEAVQTVVEDDGVSIDSAAVSVTVRAYANPSDNTVAVTVQAQAAADDSAMNRFELPYTNVSVALPKGDSRKLTGDVASVPVVWEQ